MWSLELLIEDGRCMMAEGRRQREEG